MLSLFDVPEVEAWTVRRSGWWLSDCAGPSRVRLRIESQVRVLVYTEIVVVMFLDFD